MIDALPETVTTENAAAVEAQLTAIDNAMSKYGFGDGEKAKLNAERYVSCIDQLSNPQEPVTTALNITGDYTISGTGLNEAVTIQSGGRLIIPSGYSVTYNNSITNNGTIVLEGNARLKPYGDNASYSGSGTIAGDAALTVNGDIAFFGSFDGTYGVVEYLKDDDLGTSTRTLTLLRDATCTTFINFVDYVYILDLAGHDLTISVGSPDWSPSIQVFDYASVTIKSTGSNPNGGTLTCNGIIPVTNSGRLTLDSGNIVNNERVAINNMSGIVTINGGTVTSSTTAIFTTNDVTLNKYGQTIINGGTLSGGAQTLEIEAGLLHIQTQRPVIKTASGGLTFDINTDDGTMPTLWIRGGSYPQGITIGGEAGVTLATLIDTDSYSYYDANSAAIAATAATSNSAIRSIGAKPVYKITASTTEINFGNLNTSYSSAIPKQTFTVKNESTVAVTLTCKRSSDHFQFEADGSASTLTVDLAPGAEHTFTIMPKGNLGVGTYEDTITITGTGGTSVSIKVKFQVSDYTIGAIGFIFESVVGGKIEHDYTIRVAKEGEEIKFRVVPDEGYYLAELKADPSYVEITKTEEGYSFIMPNQTVTITPTFKKPTVTFDMNGHGAAISAVTVDAGTAVNAPTAPTAEGYTFDGWYIDVDCTNAYDFSTTVTADITLYAKWTENKPAHSHDGITYDTKWSGEMAETTISESTNIVLTGNATLSARLRINSGATVNLCLNGKTLNIGGYQISNSGTLNICDCQTGGSIIGTNTVISNSGTCTISSGSITSSENINLYGIWNTGGTLSVYGGTIQGPTGIYISGGTCNIYDGKVIGTHTRAINIGTNVTCAISGGRVECVDKIAIYNRGTCTVSNGTVYGYEGINNLSGTCIVTGGTITGTNDQGIDTTGPLYLSGNPSITGKTGGLVLGTDGEIYANSKADGTGEKFTGTAPTVYLYKPEESLNQVIIHHASEGQFSMHNPGYTLIQGTGDNAAHLVLKTAYTVKFNSMDGSAVASQTVISGGTVTEPAAPTKTDFTFGGWYKEAACTNEWKFATDTVNENMTLYAKWTENTPAHSHDGITYDTEWSGEMAVLSISANTNIVLTGYTTLTDVLVISSGKTVNLCLNGYTLALGENYISNYGTLNICDCSEGKTGTITGSSSYGIINNLSTGTVVVSSGTLSGEVYGIFNQGTLKVTGGSVSGATCGIYNYNILEVTGGAVSGTGDSANGIYNSGGTVKVTGGTIYGKARGMTNGMESAVEVSGNADISGGSYGIYIVSDGTATVSGGKVSGDNYGIYNSGGTVTVSGGSVTSEERGIYSASNGTVKVTDGTVSGKKYGIDINGSAVEVSGGSVTSEEYGIENRGGTVTVSGGSVSGTDRGIYISYQGSTVEISGGTVSSTNSEAINNYIGSVVKISGGTVTASGSNAIHNNGTLYLSGTPTIQKGEGMAHILFADNGVIYATATDELTSTPYSGAALDVSATNRAAEDGKVVVKNAKITDGKFNLVNTARFYLAQGLGSNANDLVLYDDYCYTVAFASNGGSPVEHQRVYDGNAATKPADPTKSGYTFGGWYTSTDGGTTLDVLYDFSTEVTADITLYAKWTEDPSIHAHCICGKKTCSDSSHEKVIFLPWSEVISDTTYISNGGVVQSVNVYLDTDAALTQTIKLVNGSTLNLCLHGHTLNTNDNQFTFPKSTGEKMNLSDCGSGGKITGGVTNAPINLGGAIFTMYSGAISDNTARAIFVGNTNAKAYILGGTLSGNSTTYVDGGGAICVQKGYLEIGGSAIISGNSTTTKGGAISVHAYSATASMAIGGNAKITGNTAGTFGGAVSTSIENGGTIASCTISGNAVISGNRAAYAGALNIPQVELVISDNVTITGNTSENAANSRGTTYYGGVYSGKSITISGNVKVYDNLLTTGDQHNLSLVNSDSYLNLVNLGTGAKLGVTRMNNKVPTESAPKVQVSTTGTPEAVAKQVKADDPAFEIIHENGAVYMNLHVHAYDQKVESDTYKVDPSAELVCGSTVEYYYSCTCGEKSTEKFSVTKEHVLTYSLGEPDSLGYVPVTQTCTGGCGHATTSSFRFKPTMTYNGEKCEQKGLALSQSWIGENIGYNCFTYSGDITNVGTATVTFKYADIEQTYTFEILPATITVTPDANQSMVYGDEMPELKYTVSGAVNGEIPAFEGALSIESQNVGTHPITKGTLTLKDNGTFKASNYRLAFAENVTFTVQSACDVGRHDLSYSLGEPNFPTGVATVTVTETCLNCEHKATADFYLTLTSVYTGSQVNHQGFRHDKEWLGSQLGYGCYTYSGDRTNVGKSTVTFKYADIEHTYTFSILPAAITVTPDANQSMVYGDTMPELKYTVSGAVNGETPAFEGALSIESQNVGTHPITKGTLKLKDNGTFKASNYRLAFTENVTFTVQSACSAGRHDFVYSVNSNVITESCKAEDCDHSATATLLTNVIGRVYNGNAQENCRVDYSDAWMGGDLTITYANNKNATTEEAPATASITYGGVTAQMTFTIGKATLTVTPDAGQSMTYGGTMPTLTYAVSGAVKNEVPGFTGKLSYSNPENAPLGTFPITLGDLAMQDRGDFKASNYTLVLAEEVFTIEPDCDNDNHILRYAQDPEMPSLILETCLGCDHKAAVEVTGYASMQYTGQSLAEKLHVNYTWEGLAGYNAWLGAKDLTVTHGDDVNVGRCDASITYEGATATFSFDITPATITVTPVALQSKVYGAEDPVLEYEATGAANGETAAFEGALTREAGENAGRYAIEQGTLKLKDSGTFKAGNYTLAFSENVEFTIFPKPVEPTIELEYDETTYDGTEKKPAVTLKDGDTLIPASDYEVSYADNVTAGTAIVTVRKKTTGNYNFTTFTASFTIRKAALTVKAEDVQIIAGEEPALTYAVTGLVPGDTFTNPALTTDAPDNTTPGTYTITVSGGTLTNEDSYEVTYEAGTLTILRKGYDIIKGAGQKVYRGYPASFTSDAPADKLVRVEVDGKTVPEWCYAVSGDDTTSIHFHAEYIKTLRSGEHTLKIVSDNGDAETTFTVRTPLGYYDSDSPKTGDTTNSLLWLSLALAGLLGIVSTLLGKKYLMKRK